MEIPSFNSFTYPSNITIIHLIKLTINYLIYVRWKMGTVDHIKLFAESINVQINFYPDVY